MNKMKLAMQAKKKMSDVKAPSKLPNMGGLKFDSMTKSQMKKKVA